jgi:hypothetical protein
VEDGKVGWCRNGMDEDPELKRRVDGETGEFIDYTVYSDSSPGYCREMSYSGIGGGVIESEHSTDGESTNRVRMSV